MSDLKLGQIIDAGQQRDAIHVAVAPVIAAHILSPGEHVGLVGDDQETVGRVADRIGIVDPYLMRAVMPGERFWLFLYPQTVTSLRHEWTHPAFAGNHATAVPKAAVCISPSEQWLRDFADQMDVTYSRLMEGAREYVVSMRSDGFGEYIIDGGRYEGMSVPDEFWPHYESVTGEKVEERHRGTFFSCSC